MRRALKRSSRVAAHSSNVFTRVLLSLYGILIGAACRNAGRDHAAAEVVSFHLSKVSYWARTVLVPLLVLQALRPRAKNPLGTKIDELFVEPPHSIGPAAKAPHQSWIWFSLFRCIDVILRPAVKVFPKSLRQRAIDRAVDFVTERLNGEDGLGAIFPAMANAAMMFDVLDKKGNAALARNSIESCRGGCRRSLLPALRFASVGHGLACHALLEIGKHEALATDLGPDWLRPLQVLDVAGD
jgi:squalene-hopene/tetraprenyl-beta-curcumene cyclase